MEIKTSGTTMLDVSDGETTWVYNSMNKQYAKIPAAQGPAAVMAVMGIKLPDTSYIHTSYKTTGQETIDIDGQKYECWVVEMQISEFSFASGPNDKVAPPKVTGAVMTSWIDKKLGIDVQFTFAITMQMGGKDIEMHQKVVKTRLKIDAHGRSAVHLHPAIRCEGSKRAEQVPLTDRQAGSCGYVGACVRSENGLRRNVQLGGAQRKTGAP